MPSNPIVLLLGGVLRAGGHRHGGGTDAAALYRDAPVGAICLYDGDAPPSNWAFCDGGSGTPDLRDRFIRGASSDGQLGTAGGAVTGDTTHGHGAGSLLTDAPAHAHAGDVETGGGSPTTNVAGGGLVTTGTGHTHTSNTDGGASHQHAVTGSTAAAGAAPDNRPPFYGARYIMRLGRAAPVHGSAPGIIPALVARFFNHTHTDDSGATFGLPTGAIVPFRGGFGGWPANWALCDGGSGTPDLRNRFLVGAGTSYARGTVGGGAAVDVTHGHAVGGLGVAANAAHTHTGATANGVRFGNLLNVSDVSGAALTVSGEFDHAHGGHTTDGGGAHTHTLSGSATSTSIVVGNLPAYYQAAFIKRVT